MSKPWSFQDHVTGFLRRGRFGDSKHPTLWPSGGTAIITNKWGEEVVVGKCRRANFFRYMKDCVKFYGSKYSFWSPLADEISIKEIPPEKYLLWIWRAGELYEEQLIELAKRSGVFLAEQVPMYIPEYNVSGKIDLVCMNPATNKVSNTEIKSVYGHGKQAVCGLPGNSRRGQINGKPRESNLIQIALYHWWHASENPDYEASRLVYGARDTGHYAEYLISTEKEEDGTIAIHYEQISALKAPKQRSDITVNSVLAQYKYVQDCLDGGQLPERDYELSYSPERIDQLYTRKELTKTDTAQYEKIEKRKLENIEREKQGKAPLKDLKPVEKGDWQCLRCQYRDVCYSKDGKPRKL